MKQLLLPLVLVSVFAPALAQAPEHSGNLEFRQVGAVSYACGGVGEDQQLVMKAEAPRHSLMLTFAVADGAYVADVDVQISDTRGVVVLTTHCEGPIMLVDLPAGGPWRVTANFNGQARDKTVATRAGRSAQATLVWPVGTSGGRGG